MNEVSKLKLEHLNGIEVNSLNYEGVVGIKGNKVYRAGEIIDTLDNDKKVKKLWNELLDNEGL